MFTPKILVVDDQPVNVRLLQHKLIKEGMDVVTAFSGEECLEAVEVHQPDVILLDVMMPQMDGYEVCARLKENEESQGIPIIFITANVSRERMIEGLDAGAADYITKPIDLEETVARVRTQLRIQEQYRKNLNLQQRLAEMRQSAALGNISHGIAHNLNNLLGIVVGYLDLLQRSPDDPQKVRRYSDLMDQAVKRIVKIVQQLNTIVSKESLHLREVPLDDLLESSLERFQREYVEDAPIALKNNCPKDLRVATNPEAFEDILGRILINAWESYPDATIGAERHIDLELYHQSENGMAGLLRIAVSDKGRGLDESIAESIFEPFVSSHTAVGRGMGLTIARSGIRNLGGDIHLEKNPGGGVKVMLTHPLMEAEA